MKVILVLFTLMEFAARVQPSLLTFSKLSSVNSYKKYKCLILLSQPFAI